MAFDCPECGREYQSQDSLTRHQRNHLPSHHYSCNQCDAKFRRKDLLTRHMSNHLQERGYQTPIRRRLPHKTACSRCSRMKVRCDKAVPCRRCSRAAEECVYSTGQQAIMRTQNDLVVDSGHVGSLMLPKRRQSMAGHERLHSQDSQASEIPASNSQHTFMLPDDSWPWLLDTSSIYNPLAEWSHTAGQLNHAIIDTGETSASSSQPLTAHLSSQANDTCEISLETEFTNLVRWSTDFRHPSRKEGFRSAIDKVEELLQPFLSLDQAKGMLTRFVDLFIQHFYTLWPLIPIKDLYSPLETLPACLWLTFAAIGAAFSHDVPSFHDIAMRVLRSQVVLACSQLDIPEADLEALCQCMGLLRVNHLYFGHARAVSTIHMMGGALTYLTKKLDLYNPNASVLEGCHGPEARLVKLEMRKRLAFGIMRQEGVVSMLFGTRPLFSADEIELPLLLPEHIWNSDRFDAMSTNLPKAQYRLSDLVNAALDPQCTLPPLDQSSLELVLYGLQDEVWRHSRRLTPFQALENSHQPLSQYADLLTQPKLTTNRITHGRQVLTSALAKCMQAIDATALYQTIPKERMPILASKVLYAVSHIRLLADVPSIHRLFLEASRGKEDAATLAATRAWSATDDAHQALGHALTIYDLLQAELRRPVENRALFNAVSHLALLHTAAIIWVLASMHESSDAVLHDAATDDSIAICKPHSKRLLSCVARVLGQIGLGSVTPSLLVLTVETMADQQFPD